jgi:four helix bundle protein
MDVLKLTHEHTLQVCEKTRAFPRFELYSLISQMRRGASSVPMNIAEGSAWNTRLEYRRFVSIAKGSVGEIFYQIILSRDLGYLTNSDSDDLLEAYDRVGMMLTRLAQSLAKKVRTSL